MCDASIARATGLYDKWPQQGYYGPWLSCVVLYTVARGQQYINVLRYQLGQLLRMIRTTQAKNPTKLNVGTTLNIGKGWPGFFITLVKESDSDRTTIILLYNMYSV